ncbi:MAG: TetR/AcrR family transcriptional regulator [Cyanobacteria bacterium J06588_5]
MTTKEIKKRGRPRSFDLDKAIATALDLFHRRGYDGVGVAELSKAMGITAPSLYSAFGNKRSLFEQVLKHYVQTQGGWLSAALEQEGDLESAMAHFFLRAAEVYTANPDRCGCLVMDATRNCGDEAAKALTAGFQQATRALICDRITQGAPEISSAAADTLADYVTMILVGLSGSARDGVSAESLRATAEIAAAGFEKKLQDYRK